MPISTECRISTGEGSTHICCDHSRVLPVFSKIFPNLAITVFYVYSCHSIFCFLRHRRWKNNKISL